MSVWNRVGTWVALIVVAAIAFPVSVAAQHPEYREASITLGRDPEPPDCAKPGETVLVSWTIQHSTTPNFVTYELRDPSDVVVDSQNYSGSTGLVITDRPWVVPASPAVGTYWIRIEYHSYEAGHEATAEVSLWICLHTGQICIQKMEDLNCDGIPTGADGPVGGWWVCIEDPGGETFCQQTNVNGVACWPNIPVGAYEAYELMPLPAGWRAIGPTSQEFELTLQNPSQNVLFFNVRYDQCFGACCLCDGKCIDFYDMPSKWISPMLCYDDYKGEFMGPGTHCDEVTCGAPSARDEKTWGQIKGNFRKQRQ